MATHRAVHARASSVLKLTLLAALCLLVIANPTAQAITATNGASATVTIFGVPLDSMGHLDGGAQPLLATVVAGAAANPIWACGPKTAAVAVWIVDAAGTPLTDAVVTVGACPTTVSVAGDYEPTTSGATKECAADSFAEVLDAC